MDIHPLGGFFGVFGLGFSALQSHSASPVRCGCVPRPGVKSPKGWHRWEQLPECSE